MCVCDKTNRNISQLFICGCCQQVSTLAHRQEENAFVEKWKASFLF